MKSGFVALIGRPNAGKSTLLNTLMKQKIAIISPKAQTTRNSIRGIRTDEDSQIIFVDTPGIHKPQHSLGAQMNKQAYSSARGVDIIYLMVDGTVPFGTGDEYVMQAIKNIHLPVFLVVNKADLISKDDMMNLLLFYNRLHDFAEIFPISALENDNVDQLIEFTKLRLEDGVKYYPDDMVCDYPEQFIMAEIIREKVLMNTQEEVPHSVAIVIERIKKHKGNLIINAMILVERNSQKGIMVGKQGSMIKKIGTEARIELSEILGEKVYLELFVRVEENWRNKESKLKQLGYIEVEID